MTSSISTSAHFFVTIICMEAGQFTNIAKIYTNQNFSVIWYISSNTLLCSGYSDEAKKWARAGVSKKHSTAKLAAMHHIRNSEADRSAAVQQIAG